MCISSLAQVHGILTVGCRQGRLVKKVNLETRRAGLCNTFPLLHKSSNQRKACQCPLRIQPHCRTIPQRSRHKTCLKCINFLFLLLPCKPSLSWPWFLCGSAIWKKFGWALLEVVLKISSAKMISCLKWCRVLPVSTPDINRAVEKLEGGERSKWGQCYF